MDVRVGDTLFMKKKTPLRSEYLHSPPHRNGLQNSLYGLRP